MAVLHIAAAALHNQFLEHALLPQLFLAFKQVARGIAGGNVQQLSLQRNKMGAQIVNAEVLRALAEVRRLTIRGQLQDVAEVVNGIVHRRGGQEVQLRLLACSGNVPLELPIT